MSNRRALFVTLSNIGDLVMTTPALRLLHAIYPQHEIDIVADARASMLLAACPFRGEILHRDKRRGWRGTLALIKSLRRYRYAAVCDLRTDFLPYVLRAERRVTRRHAQVRGEHAVEQHHAVATELADDDSPIAATQIWIAAQTVRKVDERYPHSRDRRLLAIAPGANWPGKIWPASAYRDLIAALRADFEAVLIIGSAADRASAVDISATLSMPTLNTCGETDLCEAAALIARAAVFVGNDSGLGHIAAAQGVPTVTVFGPGQPQRYRPWGQHVRVVQAPGDDLSRLSAAPVAAAVRALVGAARG